MLSIAYDKSSLHMAVAVTLLRFVAHEDVQFYEAEGWVISSELEGTYHGGFSVLMVLCENVTASQLDAPSEGG